MQTHYGHNNEGIEKKEKHSLAKGAAYKVWKRERWLQEGLRLKMTHHLQVKYIYGLCTPSYYLILASFDWFRLPRDAKRCQE